jgi:hypothetical protein
MALENTDQDNPSSEEIEEKGLTEPKINDDTGEEQQHILAPGICDICAEFYHFLVSGTHSPNL